jgi:hypothetical protein
MGFDQLRLFRGQPYELNSRITIEHPKLEQICDYGEQSYWMFVNALVARPFDYKVQLDDAGIDYENVKDLDLFFMICKDIPISESKILLGDLNIKSFKPYLNKQNDDIFYYSEDQDIVIDTNIHRLITDYIRTLHYIPKRVDKAGNAHTKKYLIETERRKQKRQRNKKFESVLNPLISAMVNSSGFKYNHETVWDLPIYTFYDSVQRIQKIKHSENLYSGIYNGCVDAKKLNQEELNWLGNLDK